MAIKILNDEGQYELNIGSRNQFLCSCSEYEIIICGCGENDCHICSPSDCDCMKHCLYFRKFIFPPENSQYLTEDSEYQPYLITRCRVCFTEHNLLAYFGAKFSSDMRNKSTNISKHLFAYF